MKKQTATIQIKELANGFEYKTIRHTGTLGMSGIALDRFDLSEKIAKVIQVVILYYGCDIKIEFEWF